jgi:hypothetical protein
MEAQSYKNHGRMVPGFHFVTEGLMFLLFIGSIVNLAVSTHENMSEKEIKKSIKNWKTDHYRV